VSAGLPCPAAQERAQGSPTKGWSRVGELSVGRGVAVLSSVFESAIWYDAYTALSRDGVINRVVRRTAMQSLSPYVSLFSLVLCACTLPDYGYLGAGRSNAGGSTESKTSAHSGAGQSGTDASGGTGAKSTAASTSSAYGTGGDTAATASTTPEGQGGNSSPGTNAGGADTGTDRGGTTGASDGGAGGTATGDHGGAATTAGSGGGTMTASYGGRTGSGGGGSGGRTRITGGGNGGKAGTAGANNGVSGGDAGYPGVAGAMSCSGCAVLNVPFTARDQIARYLLRFAPVSVNAHGSSGTAGASAVTNAGTLKVRAYAPRLGNTEYELFIQQSNNSYTLCDSGLQSLPSPITSYWVTLEWSLGSCSADTNIGRMGIDLVTSAATSAPAPGSTTLWIDSMWIELNGNVIVGPYDFDAATTVNPSSISSITDQNVGVLYLRPTIVQSPTSSTTPPAGSSVSWLSN
jgi:hypothetical protein